MVSSRHLYVRKNVQMSLSILLFSFPYPTFLFLSLFIYFLFFYFLILSFPFLTVGKGFLCTVLNSGFQYRNICLRDANIEKDKLKMGVFLLMFFVTLTLSMKYYYQFRYW